MLRRPCVPERAERAGATPKQVKHARVLCGLLLTRASHFDAEADLQAALKQNFSPLPSSVQTCNETCNEKCAPVRKDVTHEEEEAYSFYLDILLIGLLVSQPL